MFAHDLRPDERDITLYVTNLSGDIGVQNQGFDNCYHVVTGTGTNQTSILDGLTISSGNANVVPDDKGGGMMNESGSSPVIRHCTFLNNSATLVLTQA